MTRLAAALLAIALAGCGFHPLYGGMNGGMGGTMATIYVEPVPDALGYELRNRMIDLLNGPGTAGGAAYHLKLTVSETSQGSALQNETNSGQTSITITRYNDTLTVTYSLTDANHQVITHGTETGLSAYNVVTSPYATLTAQQSADKNAAVDIAYRIRTDLAVYFAQSEQPRPLPPKK